MKNIFMLIAFVFLTKGFSQDPELLDKTWYLHYGILNGEAFEPPQEPFFTTELYFVSEDEIMYVWHPYCEEGLFSPYLFGTNSDFNIDDTDVAVVGICGIPDYSEFMYKHYYIYITSNSLAKNPFTYTLESDGDNYMLTIENGEGDIAVYGDVALSVTDIENTAFVLYPNPVTDILTLSSKEGLKEVAMYDIHGRLVETIRFNNNNSVEMDVRHLQNGMYFIKIKTESGRTAVEKFIKK